MVHLLPTVVDGLQENYISPPPRPSGVLVDHVERLSIISSIQSY
jgi:hypothetical protein